MKKVLVIVLALIMALTAFGALSETKPVYLALGDSITTGYGLKDNEKSFPEIVAEDYGYTLYNYAVNGNTAPGILQQIADPAILGVASKAEVISITCGGNDLMGVLYQAVADIYNAVMPEALWIQPSDILLILSNPAEPRYQGVMVAAQTALSGNEQMGIAPFTESAEIESAMSDYLAQMGAILMSIKEVNPNARIIVATQYNPYRFFSGTLQGMNDAMEAGAQMLTSSINSFSMFLGYEVADVYTAFTVSEENLCNADMATMNLDFHPNAKGHEVIAECVKLAIAS